MKQRGFTLLEMIIGITLLGFILALLYGGLRLGVRSWDAGEQRVATASRQVIVSDFLRRLLGQTYPLHWTLSDGKKTIAFDGTADTLNFAAPLPARLSTGGIELLQLKGVSDDDGSSELRLSWRLPDPKVTGFDFQDQTDTKDQAHLVTKLKKVEFAYFGALNANDDSSWQAEWHSDNLLPQLIRIRLIGNNGQRWPDMVVALKVSSEAGCMWDSFFKQCI